jgi:hypothetical protein
MDPYCVVKDLFSEISKKNLENNKGNARCSTSKLFTEETKTGVREEITTSLVIERSSFKEARSFLMIEPSRSRSHNNSLVICNKEFQRQTAEDSETVVLSMLINGNDEEVLRIQFPYDLSKDSPKAVAKEMVKALSLSEEDLEKLQSAIESELSNRETESKKPNKPKRTSPSVDKELHGKVEEILGLADNCIVDTKLEFDACRTIEELDSAFMLEMAKLTQWYRTRAKEINNSL